jgi:hypothetical protein
MQKNLKFLNNWSCYRCNRWYCNNYWYVWCGLCETVDILTGTTPVVCLVLNVERNKIGAIALDSDIILSQVYMQFVVVD